MGTALAIGILDADDKGRLSTTLQVSDCYSQFP